MRRWLPWIIATILLAAVAGVSIVALQEDAPFDFLHGHPPLPLPAKLANRTGPFGGKVRYYHFQADYDKLKPEIIRELEADGLASTPFTSSTTNELVYYKGDLASWSAKDLIIVTVRPNARFEVDKAFPLVFSMHEPGWISVQIEGEPKRHFLARLRRIFAL